jgi:hypothetical protein
LVLYNPTKTGGNMLLEPKYTYIKATDVTEGDTVTILDEGYYSESKKFQDQDGNPKKDFTIAIEHKGVDKRWTVNGTSLKALIKQFGRDTAQWIGKTAQIYVTKYNNKDTIFVK